MKNFDARQAAHYVTMWLQLKQNIFGKRFPRVSIRRRNTCCVGYCNNLFKRKNTFALHKQLCQLLKSPHWAPLFPSTSRHMSGTWLLPKLNNHRIQFQPCCCGDIHSKMLQKRVKNIDQRTNRTQVTCWIAVKQSQTPKTPFQQARFHVAFVLFQHFCERVPVQVFTNLWWETMESLNKRCKPPCAVTVCVFGGRIPQMLHKTNQMARWDRNRPQSVAHYSSKCFII